VRTDLERGRENRVTELASTAVLVPHHGGTGNTDFFWEVVSRKSPYHQKRSQQNKRRTHTLAIISCGENDPGLPSSDTIERLRSHGALVRCTGPNSVCIKDFSRIPPCIRKTDWTSSLHPGPLPKSIRVERGTIPELPFVLKRDVLGRDRSLCLDVFSSGKKRIRYYGRGKCRWDPEVLNDFFVEENTPPLLE